MGIRVENLAEKRPVYVYPGGATRENRSSVNVIQTLDQGQYYVVSDGEEVDVVPSGIRVVHRVSGSPNPESRWMGSVGKERLRKNTGVIYHHISFRGISEVPLGTCKESNR